MTVWERALSTNSKNFLGAALVSILWCSTLWAHGGKHHEEFHQKEMRDEQNDKTVLERINSDYLKTVRPIFETKCFACHAQGMNPPWYGKLPPIKGMIEYDVTEAKKHLDMTYDFPFKGHGQPREDLKAIQETLQKGEMPPLRYRMVHWSSSLSNDELKAVQIWVSEASQNLESKTSNKPKGDHQ